MLIKGLNIKIIIDRHFHFYNLKSCIQSAGKNLNFFSLKLSGNICEEVSR